MPVMKNSYYALKDCYNNYIGYDYTRGNIFITKDIGKAYTTARIDALKEMIEKYKLHTYIIKAIA